MLIRIFPHGKGNGKGPVDYLLDHETYHKNARPELLKGNPDLTKFIIDDLNFKHKYISGVISFRDNEKLTKQQMHNLIEQFERVFCPFDDPARVNFLWVLHTDKGNQEIHFVTPRVDIKTGLAFNLHPPGKVNLMFFENFVKAKNHEYGFEQVTPKGQESKPYTSNDYKQSLKIVSDLCIKRAKFIETKYCKKQKRNYNKKKGLENGMAKNNRRKIKTTGATTTNSGFNNSGHTELPRQTAKNPNGFTQSESTVRKSETEPNPESTSSGTHHKNSSTGSKQHIESKTENVPISADTRSSTQKAQDVRGSPLAFQIQELTALMNSEFDLFKRIELQNRLLQLQYQLEIEENAKKLQEEHTKKLKI